MDFLDPKKKRANIIRLFVGYVLVAIGLAIAAFIVLLQVYGYDVDRKTGAVIQNGLIFVDSQPVSSEIYVNGELNRSRTDAKLALPSGAYTIELKSQGYRPWQHAVNLEGGGVERLVYPRLFPENLEISNIKQYESAPRFASASPDRQWLLVQRPGSHTTFDSFNLINFEEPPKTLEIPSGVVADSTGTRSFSLVEWSTDNRHVLLKHSYKGGYEFIIFDREQPSQTVNLNTTMGSNPTSVSLRDKKYDKYYVYYGKTKLLQTYDLASKRLEPFLTDVISYKSHGNDVMLYASPSDEEKDTLVVKLKEGDQTYTLNTYKNETGFLLDIARFDNAWYAVVTPLGESATYIYRNPQAEIRANPEGVTSPLITLRLSKPRFLSFSENTRFIAVQSGAGFAVYDIETSRRHYYELDQKVPVNKQAKWMDGHRLALVLDRKTTIFDFDGTNSQILSPALDGSTVFFDRDYEGLYNIAPAANTKQSVLTRTELVVTP